MIPDALVIIAISIPFFTILLLGTIMVVNTVIRTHGPAALALFRKIDFLLPILFARTVAATHLLSLVVVPIPFLGDLCQQNRQYDSWMVARGTIICLWIISSMAAMSLLALLMMMVIIEGYDWEDLSPEVPYFVDNAFLKSIGAMRRAFQHTCVNAASKVYPKPRSE